MASTPTFRLLTLAKLRGVGSVTLNRVAARADFSGASLERIASWEPSVATALEAEGALARAEESASKDVDATYGMGARVISVLDSEYPELLAAVSDRPPYVFVKGDVSSMSRRAIAVIGTREPTRHGVLIAQRIATYFATRQWSVVSGLALGVDGVAHQAALDAAGRTVAVLAHGLDTVYPKKHAALAARIVDEGGALVSEYPPGAKPYGPQFVKRDRVQAALALSVVLVQTDVRGGSLHASRASLRYGRLLAVPMPTPADAENLEPKIEGIRKILDSSAEDVARYLECRVDALRRLLVLRSREDYAVLEERIASLVRSGLPTEGPTQQPLWAGGMPSDHS